MPETAGTDEYRAQESNPLTDTEAPDLRHLFRHGFVYLAGAVGTQLIGFFLIPLYTHYLTPADYGILEILDRGLGALGVLGGLGLARAVVRYYFEQMDDDYRRRVLATGSLTRSRLSRVSSPPTITIGRWISIQRSSASSFALSASVRGRGAVCSLSPVGVSRRRWLNGSKTLITCPPIAAA